METICDGRSCGQGKHIGGGKYLCPHNNLASLRPDLAEEWHLEKNDKRPDEYRLYNNSKVWWICSEGHEWETKIPNRVNGSGCPYCHGSANKVTPETSFAAYFPEIAKEWHPTKNEKGPHEYRPKSNVRVWWMCQNGHEWETKIASRTTKEVTKCPWCSGKGDGKKVLLEKSLLHLYPDIAEEWDKDKNGQGPEYYSPGSNISVHWQCRNNPDHRWKAKIYNRVGRQSKCPFCSTKKGYSDECISWLHAIEEHDKITIRHALSPEGEYYIPGIGKVDGYCEATGVVYEFHGDYWHGNPKKYHPDEINEVSGFSFGDLYQQTLERDEKIIRAGYRLVTIWQSEWKERKQGRSRRMITFKHKVTS